jgi:hypothetical protein
LRDSGKTTSLNPAHLIFLVQTLAAKRFRGLMQDAKTEPDRKPGKLEKGAKGRTGNVGHWQAKWDICYRNGTSKELEPQSSESY